MGSNPFFVKNFIFYQANSNLLSPLKHRCFKMKRIIIISDKRIISHFQISYNRIIVIQNENDNITMYNNNNNGKLMNDCSTVSYTIH